MMAAQESKQDNKLTIREYLLKNRINLVNFEKFSNRFDNPNEKVDLKRLNSEWEKFVKKAEKNG